jgi:hypothetical protein
LKTTTKDINIYKFGNEHNFISINILETWRISEQSLLLRYEPIFEYYLRWVIDESPNERNFIEYIKFCKFNNSEVLLQSPKFSVYPEKGLIIEKHTNKEIELDCMIMLEKAVILIKGSQLWLFEETNPENQYYFEI